MSQSSEFAEDPYNLRRFVEAQASVYRRALGELREGSKRTHWIWYVFPQVAGLGHSSTAQRYSIRCRGEALDYVTHPVLGARLVESTLAVIANTGKTIQEIFGSPDDMKFRSSMTLFATVGEPVCFHDALDRFYAGQADIATLNILNGWDH